MEHNGISWGTFTKATEEINVKQNEVKPIVLNEAFGSMDYQHLLGFSLIDVHDVDEGRAVFFTFENEYHARIDMCIDSDGVTVSRPYAVDHEGKRI